MAEEFTIPEAARRLRITGKDVRRLLKKGELSGRQLNGRGRPWIITRNALDRYRERYINSPGQTAKKKQSSLTRTLSTFMSVQQPIEEKRLNEILKPLDSEQRSTLRDPDEAFDHFFCEMGFS